MVGIEPRPRGGSKPGERSGGRKKGTPNKLSAGLREMILGALEEEGGQAYLREQARKNPTAIMALLGKILPTVVDAKVDQTVTHRIDAPEKETREEWLARHAGCTQRGNTSG